MRKEAPVWWKVFWSSVSWFCWFGFVLTCLMSAETTMTMIDGAFVVSIGAVIAVGMYLFGARMGALMFDNTSERRDSDGY